MSQPKKREAPAAMVRSGAQENNNDSNIIASLTDSIKASALTKPDPFSLAETDPGDAQESVICAISAVTERGLAEPRRRGGALR